MGKARDWADAYTLLCEECGYPLETLPGEKACPECGRGIASSRAEARVGSAWQQRPGVRSWLATARGVLTRPSELFSIIRVEPHAGRRLLGVNLALAGAMVGMLLVMRISSGRHWAIPWSLNIGVFAGKWSVPATAALGVSVAAAVALVFWFLTWIETVGVRYFHSKRGERVNGAIAWSVCAHASFGWVIAAVLFVAGWGLIDLDFWVARWARTLTIRPRLGDWAAVPAGAGLFAGMMLFEYRVYQGMRRCRFANSRRPSQV